MVYPIEVLLVSLRRKVLELATGIEVTTHLVKNEI
jgi:hypothetical protein